MANLEEKKYSSDFHIIDGKLVKYRGRGFRIEIPSVVTSIEEDAFYNCDSIMNVTLPEGIVTIKDSAFSMCTNLVEIKLPNSVVSIGKACFSGCSSLAKVDLGSVQHIGEYAFSKCAALSNIIIPKSVKTMGKSVFFLCSSLYEVNFLANLLVLPSSTFEECKASVGGAIYFDISAVNEFTKICFVDCYAFEGSACYIGGGAYNASYVVVSNTKYNLTRTVSSFLSSFSIL